MPMAGQRKATLTFESPCCLLPVVVRCGCSVDVRGRLRSSIMHHADADEDGRWDGAGKGTLLPAFALCPFGCSLFCFLLRLLVAAKLNFAYRAAFFSAAPFSLTERRKDKQRKPTKLLCSHAFPRRLCVRAPLTNVALEMWIHYYGKLSC